VELELEAAGGLGRGESIDDIHGRGEEHRVCGAGRTKELSSVSVSEENKKVGGFSQQSHAAVSSVQKGG
jgi:hypothetical protein